MSASQSVVILIAAGRSGSKFVRDLMAQSRHCAVVPFDVNFVWRYGSESSSSDVLDPARIGTRQRSWIRRHILQFANRQSSGAASILVEKSVSNSLRVPFVRAIFPEAKIVHLVRDGRAVCESARRVWNDRPPWAYSARKLRYVPFGAMPHLVWYAANQIRKGERDKSLRIWGPRYPGMEEDLAQRSLLEVCATQWRECVRRAKNDLRAMAENAVFSMRYEDFVTRVEVVRQLCSFTGIPDAANVESAWRGGTDRTNLDKWRSGLSEQEIRLLNTMLEPELRCLGYER